MHYLVYYGIICWLFLVPIQAQQRENASQQKSGEAEASISPPTPSPADNVNVKEPEGPIQEAKPSENQTNRSGQGVTRAEWMQIGINGLLFVVVLWQTLIYVQQRNAMQKQIEIAGISERAYMGLVDMRVIELIPNKPIAIRVVFKNGGRTPAWDFRSHFRMVASNETTNEIVKKYPVELTAGGGSFIAAGQVKSVRCPFNFSLNEWQLAGVTNRMARLLILIEITFKDFQGNVQAFSFRAVYDPDTNTFNEEYYEEANPN